MIKSKLINTMTKEDAEYIMLSILNVNPSKFSKDKKYIKNIGDKELIRKIEKYLTKDDYNKIKTTIYLSKEK